MIQYHDLRGRRRRRHHRLLAEVRRHVMHARSEHELRAVERLHRAAKRATCGRAHGDQAELAIFEARHYSDQVLQE